MMQWLPEDVSPYGGSIDALFYFIYYITAAAFILVTALMIIFLYQYRRDDSRRAVYTHGNTGLELVWTIVPALVFNRSGTRQQKHLGRGQAQRSGNGRRNPRHRETVQLGGALSGAGWRI